MRKMYVATAETQEQAAFVDQIYTSFVHNLEKSQRYATIPVDSIQRHFGEIFLSDYTVKLDAVDVLDFARESGLEVVLFFYIEDSPSGYNLYVKAVEFPSDIFISDLHISLSLNSDDIPGILGRLESFIDMIWLNRHELGFSFFNSEKGILFLTDDIKSFDLRETIRGAAQAQTVLDEYSRHALKIKVRELDVDEWPVEPEQADSILHRINAHVLFLISGQYNSQIYFPTQIGHISILDNTLPLWPPYPGFRLFSVKPDSAYGYALACSLYPQAFGAISDLISHWSDRDEAATSLFLKNIQTIQASDRRSGFEKDQRLSDLYESLSSRFSRHDGEFGWIKLNHAALLKEMGDLEESQRESQAAFESFFNVSNSFGQLFSLVQIGDTFEKLNRTSDALFTYENALNYSKRIEDEQTTAYIYYRLGSIKFENEKLFEAWDYFGQSAESYLRVGDTLKVVQLNTKLGTMMRQSNFLKKSNEYLLRSMALARHLDNDRETADAGYQLAVTLKDMEKPVAALEHFQAAGDLMEMLADTIGLANVEEHIGDILFAQEQWKKAQQSFEYAARFYKYIPDVEGIIRSVTKAGDTAAARKRWLRAQNDYDEALQFANLYEKTDWVSIIIYKKGLAHVRAGEYALGQEELELARQGDVSPEAINSFMKSFIRDLEQELRQNRP